MTSQRAGPAAAMVAKDYPFYLTVKRANCSLEVPPASSPAKDSEVGPPPGPFRVRLSLRLLLSLLPPCVTVSLFPSLTLCIPLPLSPSLIHSFCLSVSLSPSLTLSLSLCLPSTPSMDQESATSSVPISLPPSLRAAASLPLPLFCVLQGSQTVNPLRRGTYCINGLGRQGKATLFFKK